MQQGNCDLEDSALEAIAIILFIVWLVGLVSVHTMGGFSHVLLVIVVRLIQESLRAGGHDARD